MKMHSLVPQDSAVYVVLHAKSRAKRGRKPSATFRGITNPRKALEAAKTELNGKCLQLPDDPRLRDLQLRIAKATGMQPMTKEEFEGRKRTVEALQQLEEARQHKLLLDAMDCVIDVMVEQLAKEEAISLLRSLSQYNPCHRPSRLFTVRPGNRLHRVYTSRGRSRALCVLN